LILHDVGKAEITFSLAIGAEEKALGAGKNDNGSTALESVSVGVHFADVSVLGKALYVPLLLGVVHFLFQRLTGLNILLVKPKLGVKDDKRLSILHQRKVRTQGDGVTVPASLAVRESVVVNELTAFAQFR
jgi:hypothetical protein